MSSSGGLDWADVHAPLKNVGDFYGLLFMLYIGFVIFGVFGIVIGIFVEGASETAQVERELLMQVELQDTGSRMNFLKEHLQSFDVEGTGGISRTQFDGFLQNKTTHDFFRAHQVHETEAQGLFPLLAGSANEAPIDEIVVGLMIPKGNQGDNAANRWYESRQLAAQLKNFMQYSREHFVFIEEMLQDVPSDFENPRRTSTASNQQWV
jgi:hypothetical protein